ncbi:MAG: transcription factor S [Methanocellales archaeon]|nr:transcription factor S [Methanocellales archaeon]MDD3290986.1 transcription factor S [Methanocellales archaeon]MDD5234871.1 transcription factor S [Methanocellales archaeon]MDD5484759.1 transcription factor S [Methanocellales archaeon]
MDFCPKCGSILLPSADMLKCRKCGHVQIKEGGFVSRERRQEREMTILEKKETGLPTTNVRCPECGNGTAYWWLRQLRSADESEVRFFKCTKCEKTWREYN